tara:strand:+ start:987 stop:1541 length:555 start_codon:yes stop_codon:yes gene_type:complete
MTLDQERILVARLKNGDRSALSDIYQHFGEKIYREAILPRLPVVELAEDVLATTFARAMEKIEQFKIDDKSIFFWLRRIAINLTMDQHRLTTRDKKIEEKSKVIAEIAPQGERTDRRSEKIETRELVEESLAMINPRYAEALRLRLIQDLDRIECAEKLGITVGNFDVLLYRATKAFRDKYPPR